MKETWKERFRELCKDDFKLACRECDEAYRLTDIESFIESELKRQREEMLKIGTINNTNLYVKKSEWTNELKK